MGNAWISLDHLHSSAVDLLTFSAEGIFSVGIVLGVFLVLTFFLFGFDAIKIFVFFKKSCCGLKREENEIIFFYFLQKKTTSFIEMAVRERETPSQVDITMIGLNVEELEELRVGHTIEVGEETKDKPNIHVRFNHVGRMKGVQIGHHFKGSSAPPK